MTMDRKPQYKPKIYRGGHETRIQDDKILLLEIDPSVEEGIKVAIEEILTIGTITGKIIEIDQEAGGMVIDQVSDYFYHIDNESNLPRKDKYLVQTRSQVRASGIRLPEIHGANKGLDPHAQPGKQKSFPIQTVNKGTPTHPIPKPRIGQGRAGLRRKAKAPLPIASPHLLPV